MILKAIDEQSSVMAILRFTLWGMAGVAFALSLFLGWTGVVSGFLTMLVLAGALLAFGLALRQPARGEPVMTASPDGLHLHRPHFTGAVPSDQVKWSEIAQIAEVQSRTTRHLTIFYTAEGARRLALRPATWHPSSLLLGLTGPRTRCRVRVLPISVPELVTELNRVSVANGFCLQPRPTLMDSYWHMTATNDSEPQG